MADDVRLSVVLTPPDATLESQLTACWADVSDAGGAVGFPQPPVDRTAVAAAVEELGAVVETGRVRLVVAHDDLGVCGWVVLERNSFALMRHWAWVRRLQSHPRRRGQGIGIELLRRLEDVARGDGDLDFLRLTLRDGLGLEEYYGRLGWQQVGRIPNALRVSADDDRDEIHMVKPLSKRGDSRTPMQSPVAAVGG